MLVINVRTKIRNSSISYIEHALLNNVPGGGITYILSHALLNNIPGGGITYTLSHAL